MTASVVVSDTALTALEREWQELAAACSTATVFQTYQWNAAWWRHFRGQFGRRLRLVIWRNASEELVGLAPLMTSFWYATPLRRLSFLGTGTSDYLDILAAPEYEEKIAHALYHHLTSSGGWQIADFQQLREGSLLRQYLPGQDQRLAAFDAHGERCPYLALPEQWEMLLQSLGKKTRANVSYYDRALQKIYQVECAPVTDKDMLEKELSRLFELHQRRWNERWLPGVFASRRVQAFHRDAAKELLAQGWLRLFYLKLDGVTQASLYCFGYADRLCYYQGGFEPTLSRLSLGTVLTARAIQTAILEERPVFDFLRGDEPYKVKWTGAAFENCRRLVTRSQGPFGWLSRKAHHWEDLIERRVKAWMRRKK